MTRVLLDTHVFLWWTSRSSRVQGQWLDLLADPETLVYLSAATAWEIETKRRINKLSFENDVSVVAGEFGFLPLPISLSHAALAGSIDWDHRDPFDRILVAQAQQEELILLSADDAIRSAPGVRVL